MPRIAPTNAIVLKNTVLEIEGDDYSPAASNAQFTPRATAVTFSGLAPEGQLTDTTEPTWTLNLTWVQDWESGKSLSKLLYALSGQRVPIKFKPREGEGLPAFTSTVSLTDGAIGGPSGAYPTATAQLGCTRPVFDSDDDPITPEPEYGTE